MRDVFDLEDEITRAIVDALKVKFVGWTPSRSSKSYSEVNDLYLQELYLSNKSGEKDLRKASDFFQKAADKDPKFSRAWTGIGKVWIFMADAYVRPLDAYPIAKAAAGKALALDERNPLAHCVLGFAKKCSTGTKKQWSTSQSAQWRSIQILRWLMFGTEIRLVGAVS